MRSIVLSIQLLALCLLAAFTFAGSLNAREHIEQPARTLVLAHYMPWFQAKSDSQKWGWHWTMNRFDPDKKVNGRSEIASHYSPIIGPYDSGDPAVLEYHMLTMKLAGIDGVIVDWYGLTDYRDYAILNRNTTRLLETAERLKMKFAICYEDQTIPALVEAKRIMAADRVPHAANEIQWLGKYWFKSPSYVSMDGKPLLLSFGQSGLSDSEWTQCLEQSQTPVNYFSQHHRRAAAVGAFDWPVPSDALNAFQRFQKDATNWPQAIPVAFPRFVDYYAEANVGKSYGRFDDDKGKSFRMMMERGLQSKARIIQLATWNDWSEGTQIEPSVEFGYRDLETVQMLRRKQIDPQFAYTPDDIRIPHRVFEARRLAGIDPKVIDDVVTAIVDSDLKKARSLLDRIKP